MSAGFTGLMLLAGKLSSRGADCRPDGESARLLALESFEILDTVPETPFDGLTALAAYVCGAPMALLSFVDATRQWIKSRHGVDVAEIDREVSFCARTLAAASLLEIPDTHLDPRFAPHPMVTGDPHVRFYAGVPIVTGDGHALGALCVMDREPRTLSDPQRVHLQTLADQVLTLLQLRSRTRQTASEIDRRLAADAALRQQQRMLEAVLEHTDVLIFAKDVDGRFVMANRALEHVTRAESTLIGFTDHDFFDAEIADDYRRNDRRIMAGREWQVFSEEVVHPDGSVHTYRSTKFPLFDDGGEVIGTGGVSTDVTELVAARAAHAAAEQRWRALVEQSPAAVIVIDRDGGLSYVNPEAVTLLGGETAEQITAQPGLDFVPAHLRAAAQTLLEVALSGGTPARSQRGLLRRVDGTVIAVEFNGTVVDHSDERSVQLEVRDVSADAAAHAALKLSASTDPLTGALNRRGWDARVAALLADGAAMTVAVLDLDNFKSYNDAHGHTAGDALLQNFAAAAGASIRDGDVFARWGGEEFIVALPDTTPDQAERILNRLRNCVPYGQTCSIGYTAHTPADTLTDTVARADKALYEAKSRGRNQLRLL
ncbi:MULTISPECIES: sensor domain-containing diguanylate cyclase [Mycolicibacterium]|uniref:Diguanylate cyclase with PAS/PAC sensor n=1 Tax=Mycolicibacterium vanbaalenii (strain DSM 7251 / JCM 13017 / BCRC 16820 / KCTC 9966 / NRRL B-24157 / PYR-1) TaxID=350058 RepID=A1T6X4_MYCVP|nr:MULTISPECIES: diguanylate cyclase [Mycolicibacterium]ABM12924.1 diguanylate cyclase with PAS/PAC sensor [Mycolicibacterium vanbaalenii PYR-1]MDW5610865.1 diguanylate cyclase [Mycolicibacterium sp. D5.8-2]WND58789.1 diguanylate cyclase [Mycolicibacterium vanbaalenii]